MLFIVNVFDSVNASSLHRTYSGKSPNAWTPRGTSEMVGFLRRHPDGLHAVECVRTRTYVDSTHFPCGRIRTYTYVRMWTPRIRIFRILLRIFRILLRIFRIFLRIFRILLRILRIKARLGPMAR